MITLNSIQFEEASPLKLSSFSLEETASVQLSGVSFGETTGQRLYGIQLEESTPMQVKSFSIPFSLFKIELKIQDIKGNALSGASVIIDNGDSVTTVSSDANGLAKANVVDMGNPFTITSGKLGYQNHKHVWVNPIGTFYSEQTLNRIVPIILLKNGVAINSKADDPTNNIYN